MSTLGGAKGFQADGINDICIEAAEYHRVVHLLGNTQIPASNNRQGAVKNHCLGCLLQGHTKKHVRCKSLFKSEPPPG